MGIGLEVFDISDPINPINVNYSNTDGSAQNIFINGDYAYIADSSNGLVIFDISDPVNPIIVNESHSYELYLY